MLNTGLGGTIYLGISDSGIVKGISLTRYQRDHFLCSFNWTLDHFTPVVPKDRCNVNFVPVVTKQRKNSNGLKNFSDVKLNLPQQISRCVLYFVKKKSLFISDMKPIRYISLIHLQIGKGDVSHAILKKLCKFTFMFNIGLLISY